MAFHLSFPSDCVHQFSLSCCPPATANLEKTLQDLFEMQPAWIWAHYCNCLASGDKKGQGQARALLAGMLFLNSPCCRVVCSAHLHSVSCSLPHRRLRRGGQCAGSVLWDSR